MVISDAEAIGRIRAGDMDAFATLVERYREPGLRLATRLLGDPDDAADAVQDAFIRAYSALDRYEERERFSAWLMRIVANRCHSLATSRRRRTRAAEAWRSTVGPAGELSTGVPDPLLRLALEEALAALPPATRDVIVQRYHDDIGYGELAERSGISVSALKMRVARGSAQLRRALLAGGVTLCGAVLILAAHRPTVTRSRPAAVVACDTLRALIHDTLGTGGRSFDTALAPRCTPAIAAPGRPHEPSRDRPFMPSITTHY